MPLARRVPKYGFSNPFRVTYAIVNLKAIAKLDTHDEITPLVLAEARLVKRKSLPVKILGLGEVSRPMVIQAHKFSKSAEEKIRAAGGRAEVIAGV
jgi:large subunit ribosomal protein L15